MLDANAEFDIPLVLNDFPVVPAPLNLRRWPPQLVFDLALALDPVESILLRHDLTHRELELLYENPSFQKELAKLTHELRESNTLFKHKAKAQAETYLETMDHLMSDMETPASTKLAIFQTLTKLAELEPAPKKPEMPSGGGITRMIVEWTANAAPTQDYAQSLNQAAEIDITPEDL